ncbi:MAG: hypothetical protein FJX84_05955 [Bacteroidetes bacterium]|nr:hypothetical protein [Bacteroidota bacterium]
MHYVEPFYGWRGYYISSEDPISPFFGREYSEFEFSNTIYNFYIHPQWDSFHSTTLFLKILFVDYDEKYCIIEFIGEWNDAIENDIMKLKRNLIDRLIDAGIEYYILIGENVLNFHYSDDCYYEEWFDDIENGWIAMINFHDHVSKEFQHIQIDHYVNMRGDLDEIDWRTYQPFQFFKKIHELITKRIG